MSKLKLELLLENYIHKASDLAEAVKVNIKQNNKIDNKTILALNDFIIAANDIAFFTDKLTESNQKLN